jgi:hypothetical protein
MNALIGDILGVGGVGDAAKALLEDIGKLIPDANLKARVLEAAQARQQQLAEQVYDYTQQQKLAEFDLLKAQVELNKAEATSESFFSRGWRPFLAWAMAATLLAIIWSCLLLYAFGHKDDFRAFDPFLQIVLGILLPLAGLRTLDKGLGVAPSRKTAPRAGAPGPELGDGLGK